MPDDFRVGYFSRDMLILRMWETSEFHLGKEKHFMKLTLIQDNVCEMLFKNLKVCIDFYYKICLWKGLKATLVYRVLYPCSRHDP